MVLVLKCGILMDYLCSWIYFVMLFVLVPYLVFWYCFVLDTFTLGLVYFQSTFSKSDLLFHVDLSLVFWPLSFKQITFTYLPAFSANAIHHTQATWQNEQPTQDGSIGQEEPWRAYDSLEFKRRILDINLPQALWRVEYSPDCMLFSEFGVL